MCSLKWSDAQRQSADCWGVGAERGEGLGGGESEGAGKGEISVVQDE